MCGRLACTLNCNDISKNCKYKSLTHKLEEPKWIEESCYEYEPTYNGPPSTVVAVMAHKNNFPDVTKNYPDYCLIPMKWGMIPSFKTDSTGNFHTHNARIENVLKSSMYKVCIETGKRCIVLATGYYEWQTTQGENNKQPYFLHQEPENEDLKTPYLMKLAGLFNITRHDSVLKYTCTILTTESAKELSWMHHRMPVILNTDKDISNWLNYSVVSSGEALKKLPKYDEFDKKYKLKYYAVNKTFVNTTSCNEKKCLERISLKRKSVNTLDGWLKKKLK